MKIKDIQLNHIFNIHYRFRNNGIHYRKNGLWHRDNNEPCSIDNDGFKRFFRKQTASTTLGSFLRYARENDTSKFYYYGRYININSLQHKILQDLKLI